MSEEVRKGTCEDTARMNEVSDSVIKDIAYKHNFSISSLRHPVSPSTH